MLVLLTAARVHAQPQLEFQQVVAAHQAAVDLIHTISVTLETRYSERKRITETRIWHSDGERQRLLFENEVPMEVPSGSKSFTIVTDSFIEGNEVRHLAYDPTKWNPGDKVLPFDRKSVRGSICPKTRMLPEFRVSASMLLTHFFNPFEDNLTLRERIETTGESPKDLGVVIVEGHPCRGVRLARSRSRDHLKDHADLFIDPSIGFFIRKCVTHLSAPEVDVVFLGESFRQITDGIYLPMQSTVTRVSFAGEQLGEAMINRVKTVEVNATLPSDAFDFRFPPDLEVPLLPPNYWDGGYATPTTVVFDHDGAVKHEFKPQDGDKRLQWMAEAHAAAEIAKGNPRSLRTIGIAVTLVGLVFALVVYRWTRHRRKL